MGWISLITVALEATMAIFGFFTRRSQKKGELEDIRDEFSKKHDDIVQKNIKLREEYEALKRKIRESNDKADKAS